MKCRSNGATTTIIMDSREENKHVDIQGLGAFQTSCYCHAKLN